MGLDNYNDYYEVSLKQARGQRLLKRQGYTEIRASVGDRDALETLFKTHQIDRVVHLAAQAGVRYSLENPHAYVDANLVGLMNILSAVDITLLIIWCMHHQALSTVLTNHYHFV